MNRFRVLLLGIGFLFLGHVAKAQTNWTEVTPSAPWSTRFDFGAVAFNGQMWVYGGGYNDVWSSPDGTNWTEVTPDAPWSARSGSGAVAFNNHMWVLGGDIPSLLNDVWSSPDGTNWTEITGSAPWGARTRFGSVVFNGQLWVLGGLNNSGFYNDVWSSPDGTNWTQVTAAAAWSARTGFGAVVFNGQMWVLGGTGNSGNLNDVWSSPDGTNWTQVIAAAPWSPRQWFGAVAFDGKVWVLGGNNGSNLNDVWSSPDGTNWIEVISAASWSQRSEFGSVVFNELMWVLGGCCSLNDVWALGSLPPPVASFTAAPTNGFAPLSVTFTDTSTGLITTRFWNFGDGGTTNLTTAGVAYAYLTAGVYTVTEVVMGPLGVSTNVQPNFITVVSCSTITSLPPAVISVSPASLSETGLQGQDAPSQDLDVWNSAANCSILTYSISSSAPWLSVSPTNGTSAGLVNTHTVTYATASLTAGLYEATITITSADAINSPQDVPVSLNVLPLVVSNSNDSGPGSLRQAIANANSASGGVILFSNVTGTISLSSGDLVITNSMSIVGPGSSNLTIVQSSFPYHRVLTVSNSTASVSISGLTISGGTPDDYPYNPNNGYLQLCGGGIYNAATLFLADCPVLGNSTRSSPLYFPVNRTGDGGGIYNVGALTMSNCTVIGNSTGSPFFQGSSQSFNAGRGAGIYNAGVLTVSGSTISGNFTGFGLWGVDGYATGDGGDGGGIYNGGSLVVSESAISSNSCGGGGGSDFDWWGGNGGSGGGIAGGGTFRNCSIYANSAGDGGHGGNGFAYSPFYRNGAPGGSGGGGGGVSGGGTFVNTTIYGNSTGSGGNGGYTDYSGQSGLHGGNGGNAGNGGGISGGGTLINCTITSNSAAQAGTGGGAYMGTPGQLGSPGNGGGIGGSSQLLNTLIANNSAAGSGPDVSGSFTSLGHNLIGNATGGSGFGATGDLLNVNLQLGPLANNGGPTLTCPLLPGSPAIDAGDDAVLSAPYNLITDQRGFPRLSGSHVDIGAFEFVFLYPGDDLCDGISDAWRAQYFGGNGAATNGLSCATCDADGTGQDNLFKYLAGLDPTNPSSIFGITAIARKSNDVLVTWTCVGSHSYVLQSTRSTAMIAEYNTNFADASPIIIASGLGPTTTNYLDVGAAYAPLVTSPGGTMVTTSVVPSIVDCSAVWTRGITDSLRQALPIGSLLMLGTFSISEPTIQSNFSAGNVSAIMSNFTPYSMSFKVGDGTGLPATWSVSLSAAGFGGQQIYLLAIDKPTFAAAKHLGIFTAPSWVFPDDGCEIDIDLEDVTDFVIGTQGGPLTINLVLGGETYTFNDTARLSYLPGRSLFYRVRLAQ